MKNLFEEAKEQSQTKPRTGVNKKVMNLAASWYVAMDSKALVKKPKAIDLFGEHLVAWRDQKGQPVIMKRYCSHMGASLAMGKVIDNCIQCPFHHWRFDNVGQCISIPDLDHIPPTFRQTIYVTEERYGYIWVWYGTQTPLFPLVEYKAAESQRHNYMTFRFSYHTKTTVLRVIENIFDQYHGPALHQLPTTSLQLTVLDENYLAQQSELPIKKEAWFGVLTEVQVKRYFGLIGVVANVLGIKFKTITIYINGYPSGTLAKFFFNGEEKFQTLQSSTPINENHTIWNGLFTIKKTGNIFLDLAYYLLFGLQNGLTVYQDVPVWNNLNADEGGAYIKHDKGVLKFREFYQSWVNKVEVE
ncbi:Rieske 2Fe-2S domain-containing protein [Nostoc sp. C117]|uniref:Rieske 2Fe-2S domain-containing protein n=1 Tax=Nostoc sp. C117 TaxID=3349875 RepID=UPI00370D2C95